MIENTNNYKGIGNEIYSGASELGKFYSIISLIFCSIIFIICLIYGKYLISKKIKYSKKVKAKIINSIPQNSSQLSNCIQYDSTVTRNNSTAVVKKYKCDLSISFVIKDKTGVETDYVSKVSSDTEIDYSKTPEIEVYYDPLNPIDCSISSDDTKIFGWILIVIGFFVIICSIINYYLTQKYKFFAGASGIMGTLNMFRK
jgi:hypothetical protein